MYIDAQTLQKKYFASTKSPLEAGVKQDAISQVHFTMPTVPAVAVYAQGITGPIAPSAAMAPPLRALDPICTGILEFLNGWAVVSFLTTCKAARERQPYLRLVQKTKQDVGRLNTFLAEAVSQGRLRLPGFGPGELVGAELVPIDPLADAPHNNESMLWDKLRCLNPATPCNACFCAWLENNRLHPESDVGMLLQALNGPREPLFGNSQLQALCSMLRPCPRYAPSWTRVRDNPQAASGLAATHYPAFLVAPADCNVNFPLILLAIGTITAASPDTVVFQ